MPLYPFQAAAADRVIGDIDSGERRILLVSPTGTGKTHLMCEITRRLSARGRVLLVVHRIELIAQTRDRLTAYGIEHGVIHGKENGGKHQVVVGMAQTIRRRGAPGFSYVLLDEAHRDEHKGLHQLASDGKATVIGFTATPVRRDRPLKDWFDTMIVATSYRQAVVDGYIVEAHVWAPTVPDLSGVRTLKGDYDEAELATIMSRSELVGGVLEQWQKHASTEKTIVFCVNVQHAEIVTRMFRDAGVKADLVTGETPDFQRRTTMAKFRAGTIQVVVNVSVYIEGLDVGDASCVVLAKPTRSLSYYLQMAGRGCRAFPGKRYYRVLDHSGNVFRFGSPSIDRAWSLTNDDAIRRARATGPTLRICQRCFYVFGAGQRECPNCEHANTTAPVRHKSGELVEFNGAEYVPLDGFINAYEKARRKAFVDARGLTGKQLWAFIHKRMKETMAVPYKTGQYVIPMDPMLLW